MAYDPIAATEKEVAARLRAQLDSDTDADRLGAISIQLADIRDEISALRQELAEHLRSPLGPEGTGNG